MSYILSFDNAILDWIQANLRNGFMDIFMPTVSALGNSGAIWIACAIILLISKKYRRCGMMVSIALVLGFVICNLCLKPLVARPRPCDLNDAVTLLITRPYGYSFPSAHTVSSFASASALCMSDKRLGIPAGILAAVIAFSRMYLYVHFPTDVLAGILLGIGAGATAWLLYGRKRLPRTHRPQK